MINFAGTWDGNLIVITLSKLIIYLTNSWSNFSNSWVANKIVILNYLVVVNCLFRNSQINEHHVNS